MKSLEKNPRALATLLMLLIFPHLALVFCRVLTARAENWLWDYDPIMILGYLGFIVLHFVFWRAEQGEPDITAAIPKFLLPAIMVILILLPLLAFLGFTVLSVRPLYDILMKVTFWGTLLLVVIGVPLVAFRGDFSIKQKAIIMLAVLGYLASPTTGPLFKIAMDRGWTIPELARARIFLVSLTLYWICAVLLFASRATKKARTAFVTFCIGLMLLLGGLMSPTQYGDHIKSYELAHKIGDYTMSTIPINIVSFNLMVVAGIVVFGVSLLSFPSSESAAKAD